MIIVGFSCVPGFPTGVPLLSSADTLRFRKGSWFYSFPSGCLVSFPSLWFYVRVFLLLSPGPRPSSPWEHRVAWFVSIRACPYADGPTCCTSRGQTSSESLLYLPTCQCSRRFPGTTIWGNSISLERQRRYLPGKAYKLCFPFRDAVRQLC